MTSRSAPAQTSRNAKNLCKHIYATSYALQRETHSWKETKAAPDDIEAAPEPKSYWQVYNLAQVNEQEMFGILLRDLCDTVPLPPKEGRGKGRPPHPLGDMIFACALKVYSEKSGRRNMTNLRNAAAAGLMEKYPSFTTVFRYMEDPALTPILHRMIEQSALPLTAVETDFAMDSSGFSTSVHDRWFDDKWGAGKKQKKAHARYLKVHLTCGVKTNVITSAIITDADSHDGQHLPEMVKATDKNFEVREVMADKAYLSAANLRLVSDVGATPLIPFKSNSKARYNEGRNRGQRGSYHLEPVLPLLQAAPGRVQGPLPQAQQRGVHLLVGEGQVRGQTALQAGGCPGERGAAETAVPQHLRTDQSLLRAGDQGRIQTGRGLSYRCCPYTGDSGLDYKEEHSMEMRGNASLGRPHNGSALIPQVQR